MSAIKPAIHALPECVQSELASRAGTLCASLTLSLKKSANAIFDQIRQLRPPSRLVAPWRVAFWPGVKPWRANKSISSSGLRESSRRLGGCCRSAPVAPRCRRPSKLRAGSLGRSISETSNIQHPTSNLQFAGFKRPVLTARPPEAHAQRTKI